VSARDDYVRLQEKVDGFFSRVEARHGAAMSCRTGCHDCCRVALTVTAVEAATITAALEGLPSEERSAIAEAARSAPADRCAALDEQGRCRIYEARPLVCRSHGLPIRMPARRGLPVVDACFRNFTRGLPEDDCVLDQQTLSTMLAAVEARHAHETASPAGTRTALRALLAAAG
jgi:hypothetical protein